MASPVAGSNSSALYAVLTAVAKTAAHVCEARDALIHLIEGDQLRLVAHHGLLRAGRAVGAAYPLGPTTPLGHALAERRIIHVRNMARAVQTRYPAMANIHRRTGSRTVLAAPMFRDGAPIGGIVIRRAEARPFSARQIALLRTFADQAALAIENARLSEQLQARNRALTEALEQQTATSEILRVISSSPTDLQPVLDAVAQNAARVCGADDAIIQRVEGDILRRVAHFGSLQVLSESEVMPISPDWAAGRAVLERRTLHIHDLLEEHRRGNYPGSAEHRRRMGHRTVVFTPLLREGSAIGVIVIRRMEVKPFTDQQIALLQTFADQAVIAIENVRLFTELQSRNRELTEALEQQTVTSEILRVISSSPTDLQPVLDTVVHSAARLCEAYSATLVLVDGDALHMVANYGQLGASGPEERIPLTRGSVMGRSIIDRQPTHVLDLVSADEAEFPLGRALAARFGHRTILAAPLLREGTALGTIVVRRQEIRAFSDRQITLLQTFADQAVIAIENVRLFTELQASNRGLSETLEQQTATSEILRVISRSPTDLQPVMDAVAENAARLCDALDAQIYRIDGNTLYRVASYGSVPVAGGPTHPITRGLTTGRAVIERRTVHVHDLAAELDREFPQAKLLQQATGQRTTLATPLLREGAPIGAILIRRLEVRPFSDKQIELLETFADQAVIAIENVRLFKELEARTGQLTRSVEQLTALGDVSRALSSTLDLETVLNTIVARANQLAGTDACSVYEYDEATEQFHLRATHNLGEHVVAVARRTPIRKGEGVQGRMAVTRQPVQIPDIAKEDAYRGPLRDVLLRTGTRALLAIPLLREDHLVGGLTVNRKTPGEFSPEVVEVLQTFATQSALAIQNARLFREIEDKGHQLEVASRHKSQFLANMSHELRTPLNAILGYTELIADNIYGEVPGRMREVLERVEKSGRHLLGLINDILDLSKIEAGQLTLNLTDYAMQDVVRSVAAATEPLAKAKGLGLEVAVPDDLPLGRADERRLMQVLLNLVGNAIKFTEAGKVAIRAELTGDAFRIAVADTGPGIADGDREKIFEEFQQADSAVARTKGGTGLGLAIARRIIEMHGGRLWLESTLGVGSTFAFTVPVRVEQQVAVVARRPVS